jgi:hypothetical protein
MKMSGYTISIQLSSMYKSCYLTSACILKGIYRSAYGALLDRVAPSNQDRNPSLFPGEISPTPSTPDSGLLTRANYPNVRYWSKSQWKVATESAKGVMDPSKSRDVIRGKKLVAQGQNQSCTYIENENGEPVDGYRLSAIRQVVRVIWVKFAEMGVAPASWGKASLTVANEYKAEMRCQFPEFRLCENDWKVQHLAMTDYPSWHSNYFGDTDKKESKKKRPSLRGQDDATGDPLAKKPKVESTTKIELPANDPAPTAPTPSAADSPTPSAANGPAPSAADDPASSAANGPASSTANGLASSAANGPASSAANGPALSAANNPMLSSPDSSTKVSTDSNDESTAIDVSGGSVEKDQMESQLSSGEPDVVPTGLGRPGPSFAVSHSFIARRCYVH